MSLRVNNHIILGNEDLDEKKKVTLRVDGQELEAVEGEPILAALLANGIIINRYTAKEKKPRGIFCGIGQCTDCAMVVNGRANVRTCVTPAQDGMVIETQDKPGKEDDSE